MNDQDLRDCFAMFAMNGLIMAYKDNHPDNILAERAFVLADAMLKVRNAETVGLPAIKKRVKK